jgi:SAM-dependent methyltransferase
MPGDHDAPDVKGRVLWYHDADGRLWLGGWRSRDEAKLYPAEADDVVVLAACNGERTLAELARHTKMSTDVVAHILSKWQTHIPRSIAWTPPTTDPKLARQSAVALDMLLEARAVEGLAIAPDNRDYHRNVIADASRQFDDVETTVSHAYSVAHPGLGGRTYGEAFFDKCRSVGAIGSGMRILEIGCGTGRFACAFLDGFARRLPDEYRTARYTMFDLAPALAASQREVTGAHAERIAFASGDIETHVFSEQFDLVIANEMIADLSVEAIDRDRPLETSAVRKYRLSFEGALRRFLVNAGAIRLLEQVAGILRPGGQAILTEYGSRDDFPRAVELGGHVEHSIHFGHLEQVARLLGLNPRCESLETFLEFDPGCHVIAADSLALLRGLSSRLFDREFSKLAYTTLQLREMLGDALDRVGNLRFVPIGDGASVICPGEFFALQLARSPSLARSVESTGAPPPPRSGHS